MVAWWFVLRDCREDARRHVNKMCMASKVPLVESGTAGYLGQVQPLLKVKLKLNVLSRSFAHHRW